MHLIFEATIVGLMIVIIGTIVSFVLGKSFSVDLPPVCKDWNKNYVMEISLFITGFLGHLFGEVSGVNKWYCKKGFACKR
jgi:hypothetical protein